MRQAVFNRSDTQELRDDIIAALEKERHRCTHSRFRRTLEYSSRVLMLDQMIASLKSDVECTLEIDRVRQPWEIQL
jgi:hypothetical protein